MNKIALYVAGDENIVGPALIFLNSVKKYNNFIDLYIFTELEKTETKLIECAKSKGIVCLSICELNNIDENYISNFSQMGRWPKYVFYNWIAPTYFYKKKYSYAIKADYDMLCLDKLDMDEILPSEREAISVLPKGLMTGKLDEECLQKIKNNLNLNLPNGARSANVGLVAFNLKKWIMLDLQKSFLEIYNLLQKEQNLRASAIKGETIEQAAFGCLQGKINSKFKALSPKFNFRPIFGSPEYSPVIVHFNTGIKPWNDLNVEQATRAQLNGLNIVSHIFLFILWHTAAKELCEESFNIDIVDKLKNNALSVNRNVNKIIENVRSKDNENFRKWILQDLRASIDRSSLNKINWKVDRSYRWLQVPISRDGNLHYEISLCDEGGGTVKIVVHFEREWTLRLDLFNKLLLIELPGADLIKHQTQGKGELGYMLKEINTLLATQVFLSLRDQLSPQFKKEKI